MKRLRPPFVVTLSALGAACNNTSPLPGNPPRPDTTAAVATATAPARAAEDAPPGSRFLNGVYDGRRVYRALGPTCYVERDPSPDRRRGGAPESEAVACPPSMLRAGWEACAFGSLQRKEAAAAGELACTCYFTGNPPPSPRDMKCP